MSMPCTNHIPLYPSGSYIIDYLCSNITITLGGDVTIYTQVLSFTDRTITLANSQQIDIYNIANLGINPQDAIDAVNCVPTPVDPTVVTASNGLHFTGDDIRLGGPLIENTTINGNYTLQVSTSNVNLFPSQNLSATAGGYIDLEATTTAWLSAGNQYIDISQSSGYIHIVSTTDSLIQSNTVTVSNTSGHEFLSITSGQVSLSSETGSVTVSANTDLQVVSNDNLILNSPHTYLLGIPLDNTESYVVTIDNVTGLLSKRTVSSLVSIPTITASNGLTKVGDDIKLGGTLSQNTTINQNGYTIQLGGGDLLYADGTHFVKFVDVFGFQVNALGQGIDLTTSGTAELKGDDTYVSWNSINYSNYNLSGIYTRANQGEIVISSENSTTSIYGDTSVSVTTGTGNTVFIGSSDNNVYTQGYSVESSAVNTIIGSTDYTNISGVNSANISSDTLVTLTSPTIKFLGIPTDNMETYVVGIDDTTGIISKKAVTSIFSGGSVITGNGEPSPSLGFVSSIYLDKLSGTWYEKTGSTTWTNIGRMTAFIGSYANKASIDSYSPARLNQTGYVTDTASMVNGVSGRAGFVYYNGAAWVVYSLLPLGTTNLSYTASPTQGIVVSDTGTDATIPLVDGTNSGLMSPSDKTKLDGITSIVSNIGTITLDGSYILHVPVTLNGSTIDRTVDLSALAVDISIASATIDPLSYDLTITDSEGNNFTVNLLTLINNGENQKLSLSGLDLSITKGDGTTILNTIVLPSTNLSVTHNAGNVVINSSTGTGITLNPATSSLAGLLLPADKVKLDSISNVVSNVGAFGLSSNTLSLPVTTNGVTTNRTIDLSSLVGILTVSNGLSYSGTNAELGGNLTKNTTINGTSNYSLNTVNLTSLSFAANSALLQSVVADVDLTSADKIHLNSVNGIYLTGTGFSTDVLEDTLVVVDNSTGLLSKRSISSLGIPSPATVTDASNGLTLSGTTVKLGGVLTQNTTITGAFNLALNQTGTFGVTGSSIDINSSGNLVLNGTAITIVPSGDLTISNIPTDNTETYVIAIDPVTGLVSKRSVSSITASSVTGIGVANKLALWTSPSIISYDNSLTWSSGGNLGMTSATITGMTVPGYVTNDSSGNLISSPIAAVQSDINYWTLTGSDIYRNSKVGIGSTPGTNTQLQVQSVGSNSSDTYYGSKTIVSGLAAANIAYQALFSSGTVNIGYLTGNNPFSSGSYGFVGNTGLNYFASSTAFGGSSVSTTSQVSITSTNDISLDVTNSKVTGIAKGTNVTMIGGGTTNISFHSIISNGTNRINYLSGATIPTGNWDFYAGNPTYKNYFAGGIQIPSFTSLNSVVSHDTSGNLTSIPFTSITNVFSASSGLHVTSNDVRLGGTLITNTTIDGGYNFTVDVDSVNIETAGSLTLTSNSDGYFGAAGSMFLTPAVDFTLSTDTGVINIFSAGETTLFSNGKTSISSGADEIVISSGANLTFTQNDDVIFTNIPVDNTETYVLAIDETTGVVSKRAVSTITSGGTITGTGSAGTVALWTSSSAISYDSLITFTSGGLHLGHVGPYDTEKFTVYGNSFFYGGTGDSSIAKFGSNVTDNYLEIRNQSGVTGFYNNTQLRFVVGGTGYSVFENRLFVSSVGSPASNAKVTIVGTNSTSGDYALKIHNTELGVMGSTLFTVDNDGQVAIPKKFTMAGYVTNDSSGNLSTSTASATASALNYWTLSGSDVYRSTGNVGIGSTPSYPVHILKPLSGNSADFLVLENTTNGSGNNRFLGIGFKDGVGSFNGAIYGGRKAVDGDWNGLIKFALNTGNSPLATTSGLTDFLTLDGTNLLATFNGSGFFSGNLRADNGIGIGKAAAFPIEVSKPLGGSDNLNAIVIGNSDAGTGDYRKVKILFKDYYGGGGTFNAAIVGERETVAGNWNGKVRLQINKSGSPATDPTALSDIVVLANNQTTLYGTLQLNDFTTAGNILTHNSVGIIQSTSPSALASSINYWTLSGGDVLRSSGDVIIGAGSLFLANNQSIRFKDNSGSYRVIQTVDAFNTTLFRSAGGGLYFQNLSAANLLVMTEAGNIGIGTTPLAKLHINGSTIINSDINESTSSLVLKGSTVTLATNSNEVVTYKNVYSFNTATATGTFRLKLPTAKRWSSTMFNMKIKGYDYSGTTGAWEATIGGYNYAGSYWVYTSATLSPNCPFTTVRFGDDGTNNIILLGTTTTNWSISNLYVEEFTVTVGSASGWGSGWSGSIISSETGITSSDAFTLKTPWAVGGNTIGSTGTLGTLDNQDVRLITNNSISLFLDKGGQVVVGSNSVVDSSKLAVYGNVNSTLISNVKNDNSGSSAYSMLAVNAYGNSWGWRMGSIAANSNRLDLVIDAAGAATPVMSIKTDGNVGLATTSPTATLDVNGTTRIRSLSTSGVVTNDSSGNLSTTSLSSLGASLSSYTNYWTLSGSDIYRPTGYVGIGKTPVASLDVLGNAIISGTMSIAGEWNNTSTGGFTQYQTLGVPDLYLGSTLAALGSGTGGTLYTYGNNPLLFYNNGVETVRISGNGNVGVGVSNPSSKLAVLGTIEAGANAATSGNILLRSKYDQNNAQNIITEYSTGAIGFSTYMYQDGSSSWRSGYAYGASYKSALLSDPAGLRLLVASSADVAVGTVLPSQPSTIWAVQPNKMTFEGRLHVQSSGYENNPAGAVFGYHSGGSATGYIQCPASGVIQIWKPDTTPIATFTNGGYVGIGVDTPSVRLHVKSTTTTSARIESTSTDSELMLGALGMGTDSKFWGMYSNGTLTFRALNDALSSATNVMTLYRSGAVKFNAYGAGILITDAVGAVSSVTSYSLHPTFEKYDTTSTPGVITLDLTSPDSGFDATVTIDTSNGIDVVVLRNGVECRLVSGTPSGNEYKKLTSTTIQIEYTSNPEWYRVRKL